MKMRLTIITTIVLNVAALAGLSLISMSAHAAGLTATGSSLATSSFLAGVHPFFVSHVQFYLSQSSLAMA